jgi:hypothetical protein
MVSSDALRSLTEGLEELPYRSGSPDDSHAPTTPMQRAFSGDLAEESSGKRVRPDATSRGIGPQPLTPLSTDSQTLDVHSNEVEDVSSDTSLPGELRLPFMRSDLRFFVLIGVGAIALVASMLLLMAHEEAAPAIVDDRAVPASAPSALAAPASALVAAPGREPAPTVPAAAPPAQPAEPVAAPAPAAPEKRTLSSRRRVRGKATAARSTVAAKSPSTKVAARKVRKPRPRSQPATR